MLAVVVATSAGQYGGSRCHDCHTGSILDRKKGNPKLTNFKRGLTEEAHRLQSERAPVTAASVDSFRDTHGKLWRDLFANSSKWWDDRSGKNNARLPDFGQKQTRETPWLSNERTPAWVTSKTVAIISSDNQKHEKLWRDLLQDPSKWRDYRAGKINPRFPDFKHKQTGVPLWLDNKRTPAWVKSEIAALNTHRYDKNWQGLFSEPSQWWDNRSRKTNPRSPDFIHKHSGEALWLGSKRTPPWVASRVTSLGPGTLNLHIISSVQKLFQYNKAGQHTKTMELFEKMQQEGISADYYIFLHVLNACAALGAINVGRRIHRQIVETGCELNPYISNCLVDMYTKCANVEDARILFNRMPTRDVVTWTAMISGYVKSGQGLEALELFQQMQREGIQPDATTFAVVLKACSSMAALEEGKRIHQQIVQCGCESNVYIGSSLVDMYAKCGSLEDARSLFNKMPTRNVVSWTAMILAYRKCGKGFQALELFHKMQEEGVEPDSTTFVVLLNVCASVVALEEGRFIHKQIVESGRESDVYIQNSLVDMYAKCGSIEDAQSVFTLMSNRDVVSWNAMLLCCVKCGQGSKALELFQQMRLEGVEPDSVSFVALVNACASMLALKEGMLLHKQIIQRDCESDVLIGSALVDMYAKCGSIEDAEKVFHKMSTHDVVSWTALIVGYVKCGQGLEALEQYHQMQRGGFEPDSTCFVAVLNACASIAALEEGRNIHKQIVQSGCESDPYVGNSLVDMYAKCGSLEDAKSVFHKMPKRDVASWNAMIMGFAIHGLAEEALALFEQMCLSGSEMNEITFICLLSACSHGGLVKEGMQYFQTMQSVYGVSPVQEHYTCMVDILGRAGHLEDAESMIMTMPFEPCAATWISLLGSCRIHENVEMGERVAKQVLKLDPENAVGYVLLSNIYAAAKNYDSRHMVQELKLGNGLVV